MNSFIPAIAITLWFSSAALGAEPPQMAKDPRTNAPLAGTSAGSAVAMPPVVPAGIFKLEAVPARDLPSIPNNQLLLVNGRAVTAGYWRARVAEQRKEEESRREHKKEAFLAAERARHFAENARTLAEIDRLRAQPSVAPTRVQAEVLVAEARQLVERYRSANEKEKADLERRASEIMVQLAPSRR